jgi:hypothetical protein
MDRISHTALIPKIQGREFDRMTWVDPKQVLINLRWLETNLSPDLDERIRRLRTNNLKECREARTAALFAYGMGSTVLNTIVHVSKVEARDFDFVMRWIVEDKRYFYPVQLKEVPPADLSATVTLDDIHRKLEKYRGERDLSVVIHMNRQTRFDYQPWQPAERLHIRELWYLGCASKDQSEWFLYGSVLAQRPQRHDFFYPTGVQNFT